MIMTEILTKEPAYYEYLDYLEIDQVLDCIAGRLSINKLQQAWTGTKQKAKYLRPNIEVDDEEGRALLKVPLPLLLVSLTRLSLLLHS